MAAAFFNITGSPKERPFIVRLEDQASIDHARRIIGGQEETKVHVQGKIVKGAAPYNPGWGFHLEPASIGFFELAMEVCDADTAYVEEHLAEIDTAFLPGAHWCPWDSRITAEVQPYAIAGLPPTCPTVSTQLDETFRDYAWNYFELHAEQRLKAFQFYISLSTAVIAGFLLLLRYGQAHKWVALLGLLLAFLSFVFWKLDIRTKGLVKNAEEALKFLDAQHALADIGELPHPLRIFARDDKLNKAKDHKAIWSGHFTYSRCFGWVFTMFAIAGVLACIASLVFLPS